MSVKDKCDKCGRWLILTDRCFCKPFAYRYDENGNEWEEAHGSDAETIAENIAKAYFEDDGEVNANDFSMKIEVRNSEGVVTRFEVTAQYSVDFSAYELESDDHD